MLETLQDLIRKATTECGVRIEELTEQEQCEIEDLLYEIGRILKDKEAFE